MTKKYWLINVSGECGYSTMVHCNAETSEKALEIAAMSGVFDDKRDVLFASCEEADESDIKHFIENDCVCEL